MRRARHGRLPGERRLRLAEAGPRDGLRARGRPHPEGIAEGDSIDKVKQAYRALVKNPNAYIVAAPGGANTQYLFQVDNAATGVVSSMSLVVQDQDRFG
ncbi:hypothetical protein [Actinokineospora xionganensis]|uniref:Uncharacterized protein n=1 Tax=Actinokineospora xionganensis TaxID=2684470 RepID=A0ABR7L2R2_9PSEU|nr:hypothetical protein [Actinokineospora xionganensis]MBC6446778.1 hypothetical protein [Actinokineospora xionganensis]